MRWTGVARRRWASARSVFLSASAALSLLGAAGPAETQPTSLKAQICPEKSANACFELAPAVLPAGGVKLFNGYLVDPKDFPAVAMAKFYVGKDDLGRDLYATCTATLVGQRALLTAAHCVDMGKKDKFREAYLIVNERKVTVTCDPDPRYFAVKQDKPGSPRASYDFALCELSWTGLPPAGLTQITFETVDVDNLLGRDEDLLMTGYGCTGLEVVNRVLIWTHDVTSFRIGAERLERVVNEETGQPAYVRTRSTAGKEPALCPGDSGGPLYTGLRLIAPPQAGGVATVQVVGPRRQRSVNSSIDFDRAQLAAPYDYLSRMAALAGTGFDAYAKAWLTRHKSAEICGVTPGAKSCVG